MSVRLIVGCIATAGIAVVSAAAGPVAPGRAAPMESAASGHPGVGKVTIIRDEYGVPHVYAPTARALFYGDGYATGQDQLWEAEALRLTATGTVAQELGPGQRGENVQSDLATRIYSGGAPLRYHYLRGETLTHAVTATLRQALNELARQHHSANPATWLQPVVSIQWSPLGIGKVPDTPWMNRGTNNQIVHVGTGNRLTAEDVVAPGQSGDPASRHFADQLRMYTTWNYKTMRLTRRDLVGHTESVLTLGVPSAPQAARNLRSGL